VGVLVAHGREALIGGQVGGRRSAEVDVHAAEESLPVAHMVLAQRRVWLLRCRINLREGCLLMVAAVIVGRCRDEHRHGLRALDSHALIRGRDRPTVVEHSQPRDVLHALALR
jgi:hypothetical protein